MDTFILPFNSSEHRCRVKWIQHLGLRSMNNFCQFTSCQDHSSFKYVFWTQLTLMLFEPGFCSLKTEKARKKRSKKRFVHATNPDQVINLIYNLAGGTICAGLDCFQFLWLFTGQAEFDNRTDLQYCSQTCLNTRTPMLSVIV